MSKPICNVTGCKNVVSNRGSNKLRKVCDKHHKSRLNGFDVSTCDICGWDKARCDKHRIVWGCEGGKYVKGNVMSLCPNCHRLVHLRRITLR